MLSSNFELKVIDFGFACRTDKHGADGFLKTYLGTRNYMAPEILMQLEYDGAVVDIFAAGVILFQMMVGRPPFDTAEASD